jgi:hypothetical protein
VPDPEHHALVVRIGRGRYGTEEDGVRLPHHLDVPVVASFTCPLPFPVAHLDPEILRIRNVVLQNLHGHRYDLLAYAVPFDDRYLHGAALRTFPPAGPAAPPYLIGPSSSAL